MFSWKNFGLLLALLAVVFVCGQCFPGFGGFQPAPSTTTTTTTNNRDGNRNNGDFDDEDAQAEETPLGNLECLDIHPYLIDEPVLIVVASVRVYQDVDARTVLGTAEFGDQVQVSDAVCYGDDLWVYAHADGTFGWMHFSDGRTQVYDYLDNAENYGLDDEAQGDSNSTEDSDGDFDNESASSDCPTNYVARAMSRTNGLRYPLVAMVETSNPQGNNVRTGPSTDSARLQIDGQAVVAQPSTTFVIVGDSVCSDEDNMWFMPVVVFSRDGEAFQGWMTQGDDERAYIDDIVNLRTSSSDYDAVINWVEDFDPDNWPR